MEFCQYLYGIKVLLNDAKTQLLMRRVRIFHRVPEKHVATTYVSSSRLLGTADFALDQAVRTGLRSVHLSILASVL
jgi:hypothetical protein